MNLVASEGLGCPNKRGAGDPILSSAYLDSTIRTLEKADLHYNENVPGLDEPELPGGHGAVHRCALLVPGMCVEERVRRQPEHRLLYRNPLGISAHSV